MTIQVENAARECERANVLIQKNTLSEAVRDERCLEEQVLRRQLSEADYQRSLVRAPTDGQILKVHTQPGEAIGPRGIVELGQTARMWVRAEVYETDIARVQIGQNAVITSDGLDVALNGTVAEIGLMVARNNIIDADPAADVDARVVEVRIRLDEAASKAVERLTNLQVRVVIEAEGAS